MCNYYSLYGNMWKLILHSRTLPLVFTIFYEELGGGTRLAMLKTICAPDSSSLKPGSGLLRESWIRGCPGSRTMPSARLLDYEDTRLKASSRVRMGLSLAWKASLAMRIFKISNHCNRFYVPRTLSGVYINRRVLVRRTTYTSTIIP